MDNSESETIVAEDSIRAKKEDEVIQSFLSSHFPDNYDGDGSNLLNYTRGENIQPEEKEEINDLIGEADKQFDNSKGTLGLALDFVLLAEYLSNYDSWLQGYNPEISEEKILKRYNNAATSSLTLQRNSYKKGIRSFHNELIELFREDLGRTNFPSSPGHHTGEWKRYSDMLESAFRLSREGRYQASQQLFDLGLQRLETKDYEQRQPPFPDPFLDVLKEYKRKHPEEEGGSAYQALCYGYVKAEWPHLSFNVSKVRTGSSRQHRHGDIDGYFGPDLMISVEVKDLNIDSENVKSQLGTMMGVAKNTTAIAIAICRNIESDARETLEEAGVRVLDDADIEKQLSLWDYHKQNRAINGMVHFFANVEENPTGIQRLLTFIKTVDPENSALAHLHDSNEFVTEN